MVQLLRKRLQEKDKYEAVLLQGLQSAKASEEVLRTQLASDTRSREQVGAAGRDHPRARWPLQRSVIRRQRLPLAAGGERARARPPHCFVCRFVVGRPSVGGATVGKLHPAGLCDRLDNDDWRMPPCVPVRLNSWRRRSSS